jgi:hypothetical protein
VATRRHTVVAAVYYIYACFEIVAIVTVNVTWALRDIWLCSLLQTVTSLLTANLLLPLKRKEKRGWLMGDFTWYSENYVTMTGTWVADVQAELNEASAHITWHIRHRKYAALCGCCPRGLGPQKGQWRSIYRTLHIITSVGMMVIGLPPSTRILHCELVALQTSQEYYNY